MVVQLSMAPLGMGRAAAQSKSCTTAGCDSRSVVAAQFFPWPSYQLQSLRRRGGCKTLRPLFAYRAAAAAGTAAGRTDGRTFVCMQTRTGISFKSCVAVAASSSEGPFRESAGTGTSGFGGKDVAKCVLACTVVAVAFWQIGGAAARASTSAPLPFAAASTAEVVPQPKYPTRHSQKHGRSFNRSLKYSTLKVFQQPLLVKLLAVVAMAVPISILGGFLYKAATGCELKDSMFKAYHTWANSPGVDIVNEENFAAGFVAHTLFVFGLFTFAVVLGITTDEISEKVQELKAGEYDVVETQHTVILGWNPLVVPVLRQMSVNVEERGSKAIPQPVVILADKDKEEMDSKLREEQLLTDSQLVVLTRSGDPTRIPDLERISAADADTIIVLNPEGLTLHEAAVEKATALMALDTIQISPYRAVLVQGSTAQSSKEYLPTDAVVERWGVIHGKPLVMVPRLERSTQILAQCALEPGLTKVLSNLLVQSFDSAEFYIVPLPQGLEGATYQAARRSFNTTCVCGVLSAKQQLQINPADERVLQAGDRLVVVAFNEDDAKALPQPLEVQETHSRHRRLGHTTSPIKHVAVLCYGERDPSPLVKGLKEFSRPGTKITLVTENPSAVNPSSRNGVTVQVHSGSPLSGLVLTEAGVPDADSVVLFGVESMGEMADPQVVGSVLQLQGLRGHTGHSSPQHVVAVVTRQSSQEVLEHINYSDFPGQATKRPVHVEHINTDQLVSGTLAQVTADPELHTIFDELFRNSGGCEIYLRQPQLFHIEQGVPLTWLDVTETVRHYGQTVIGYKTPDGGVVMCPTLRSEVTLTPDHRLVVIADD